MGDDSTTIWAAGAPLAAELAVPPNARGVVLFAHGSGSSRHSPRNQMVARRLQSAGFATLLVDLLTPDEERIDERTTRLRFDVDLLATRLVDIIGWLQLQPAIGERPIGLFGASTGAAAALLAAATRPVVQAVVSRGGRPDLAGAALTRVRVPTLLLVGGADPRVLELNEQARHVLGGECRLQVVPGATHLFQEPGTLQAVAAAAADWFDGHLHGPIAHAVGRLDTDRPPRG